MKGDCCYLERNVNSNDISHIAATCKLKNVCRIHSCNKFNKFVTVQPCFSEDGEADSILSKGW